MIILYLILANASAGSTSLNFVRDKSLTTSLLSINPWQWTMYGHDLRHTHLQSGKGAMSTAPVVKWSYVTGNPVESYGPCLADINGDGKLEVIFGSCDNKVYALNYDGSLLWSYTTGEWVYSSPAVADINNDGLLEVIIGSYDDKVYALNYDGSLLWSYTTGNEVFLHLQLQI